ncbi:MAG: hypothetical protein ACYC5M_08915 [Anaerolineae bacterium]
MKVTVFEGTPEEYQIFAQLQARSTAPGDSASSGSVERQTGDIQPFLRMVLHRRELSDNPKALLKALGDAGNGWLSSEQLASQIGLTRRKLAGVLGALGRRIINTPGYDDAFAVLPNNHGGITLLLEFRTEGNEYHYRLWPHTRSLLEEMKIIGSAQPAEVSQGV